MMDPITEYILNEGYLLSDKTVSVDLEQFENGTKNKLLIMGVMGSGKTTLAEILAKKYKVKWRAADGIWYRMYMKHFKGKQPTPENKRLLEKLVNEELIRLVKSNERMIIEGVSFIEIYRDTTKYRKLILDQPMIIIGLSSLRGGIRGAIRNREREDEGPKTYYWMVKRNMKEYESTLKIIRKAVSGNDIKEYQIPKFKTVLN